MEIRLYGHKPSLLLILVSMDPVRIPYDRKNNDRQSVLKVNPIMA